MGPVSVCFKCVSYLWHLVSYFLKRTSKKAIQYQPVCYVNAPLSTISRHRLNVVSRKFLVLDLDETLIHSHHDGLPAPPVHAGSAGGAVSANLAARADTQPPDFVLRVMIDQQPVRFSVHKRPHVDYFLSVVSKWYKLVVFTASMEVYGSSVADELDGQKGMLKRRFFRQHCTLDVSYSYSKDLRIVHSDMSSVILLDNSPSAYRNYKSNAIPIKSWFGDSSDTCLLNLLPFLDALRFVHDVRCILGRNTVQY
ncbi:CTD nuclear envelope phosphatase 1-like [Symsagittifera roscoffensis]|uniref:CTD nuclear envelope phosphatase 1-like n=1 Tax=Symsagittifera roscoffensis TaxID=84072 RepID=UPI00307B9EF8